MNKTAIKKFAIESRQKLIKSVIERLEELGITDKEVLELVEQGGVYTVKALTLTEAEKKNRKIILSKIEEKGYEAFVEEVAYTWFNRIIAIRYMEVNDYLPFRTRVLSSEVQGKVDPDIITEIADYIEELELNRDKVIELKEQSKQEELFKYVFIKVCNYLGKFLPVIFEQIEDYTELLLPSLMISNGSVIKDMIELVPEEDWTNQIEIIGWLYQYYISEKKDQVFADLKKNKKITKENIPAATQLFTPEWIVKYMVENSLGRLWLEGHPNEELKSKWKYYLEEAEQEESVEIELTKLKKESEILTPEDLTIIDPAMGSGHILVYAFDVLYQIYQSEGYSEKQIPRLILEKNIHGLDIDNRAGQLAYFALMMKARSYSRRFFNDIRKDSITLNVIAIKESNEITSSEVDYLINEHICNKQEIYYLINIFKDAKSYGSILSVKNIDLSILENILEILNSKRDSNMNDIFLERIVCKLSALIKQTLLMANQYYICITNPPYMGIKGMNTQLVDYLKTFYPMSKTELGTVFIERCIEFTKPNSFTALITMHSWMFLSSLENLRKLFYTNLSIDTLVHLGSRAFEEINGEVVQTVSFVMRKTNKRTIGKYVRLVDYYSSNEKEVQFFNMQNYYNKNFDVFADIPGVPLAYWLSTNMLDVFKISDSLEKYTISASQNVTGNNSKYLRMHWEVCQDNIGRGKKWIFYAKGGGYRKWTGNLTEVINWTSEARNVYRTGHASQIIPEEYWYRKGITWGLISSNDPSFRILPENTTFDKGGSSVFLKNEEDINIILAFLNSKVALKILRIFNTTINYQVRDIRNIPFTINSNLKRSIERYCDQNITISQREWDSYETAYGFKKHPFLNYKTKKIKESLVGWENYIDNQFESIKQNEIEINKIFIELYNLSEEINSEIEDKDISIRKVERNREMQSFISYAVGCMMGRYSLDEEGLIFAGGEFDSNRYETFKANEDGILLISDIEYFEDDLLNRFVEFVKVVYSEETLEENLNFIADTECFKRKATESSRDCLRRYFLKGFMEDHLKVYQKRPIYWMFDSGKQNGFKALIYLHRYNEDTVAKVRTDYLHPLQRKYEAELERLDQLINLQSISASEKGKAKKRQEQIHKQLDECTQYDLLLAHVAHQRISLDLDDGVKVNYQKFQNIELTTDGSSKAKKGDLLYKVKM